MKLQRPSISSSKSSSQSHKGLTEGILIEMAETTLQPETSLDLPKELTPADAQPIITNGSSIVIDEEAGLHTPSQMRFCKHFLKRLDELIWVHSRASEYYEKLHHRILTPSILISGTSGVVSFLSTSASATASTKETLGIVVGIMASISTITQSLMGAFAFQAKSDAHRSAAEEYVQLQVKVHFELAMPNEPDFMSTLETKLLEIKNKCKYFPPQHIVDSYHKFLKSQGNLPSTV